MVPSVSRVLLAVAYCATSVLALGYNFSDNVPASANPPASLSVSQVPQFVCIGFDDNAYSGLSGSGGDGGMTWATNFFAGKTNPAGSGNAATLDGTTPHASYFLTACYAAGQYSESPTYVKRAWHEALLKGNDVGNHTQGHLNGGAFTLSQWQTELQSCNDWLKKPFDANEAVSNPDGTKGIGATDAGIIGFRTPFLEYNAATFQALKNLGFTYDCSVEEGWDAAQNGTNFLWPYTLNNGSPGNNVLVAQGQKENIGSIPGLWEMGIHPVIVPPDNKCAEYGLAYSLRNKVKTSISWFNIGDGKIQGLDYNLFVAAKMTRAEALATLKYTLDLRLAGNRAPFMFGCHTDEYSPKYTYAPNATTLERQQVVEEYITYALSKSNVRVASMAEIIAWMRNPVPLGGQGTVYHTINASIVPHTVTNGSSCGDPAWLSTPAYLGTNVVSYNGHKYTAKWWNQDRRPDLHSNNLGENCWTDNGSCGGTTTTEYYGTVSPLGAVQVANGTSQTFSITPLSGCHVEDVTVDGVSVGAVTAYTFNAVSAGHTLVANFASGTVTPVNYTISASAGANGSISPAGAATVAQGTAKTYTISANSGYVVDVVSVDGVSVGSVATYTFSNVTANHTIAATFKASTVNYTITASAAANGAISPVGAASVAQGTAKTYTISANSGYVVDVVSVDGVSVGSVATYTFNNVTANHTIAATFKASTVNYTISASAGTGGTISPSGAASVAQGTAKTYTVAASTGYAIDYVSVDGVSVGAVASHTFSNVTANHTITATFKLSSGGTCTGVPAWNAANWVSYKVGDFVTSANKKYRCKALGWCHYDPAGSYGSYSWEFVSACQ